MKRFRFTLASLLGLREREEEKVRLALGEITSLCNQLDMKIEILAQERVRALHSSRTDNLGQDLFLQSKYLARIEAASQKIIEERTKAEMKREEVVKEYQEAHKNVEILHRLREKQRIQYRKLNLKEEQRSIDDIAGNGNLRQYS